MAGRLTPWPPPSAAPTNRSCRIHTHVVRGEAEPHLRRDLEAPASFGLPHRPNGLAPAEDLLNPIAHPEADGVAGCSHHGAGHCAAPVRGDVLGEVRLDALHLQVVDKVVRVVGFVRAQGRAFDGENARRPCQCRLPLGSAVRLRDLGVNDEAVTILHQPMRHVAQLRGQPLGLLVQAGLWVGGRCMGGVAAQLALEVNRWVATNPDIRPSAVLGLEALVRGPGFNEGAG